MRLIGVLDDEEKARLFSDYLTKMHIDNQMALEADGTCEIWVISEDNVEKATQIFVHFIQDPDNAVYRDAPTIARKIRKQKQKEAKEEIPYIDARTTVFNKGYARQGSLTLFLIIISAAVSLFSRFGDNYEFLGKLFLTEIVREGGMISYYKGFPEIFQGQVWRLITPIFIHFGILHLVFNMWWLKDLGSMIEEQKGWLFLAIFVSVTGIAGNLLQYLFAGPSFGGMSGVVYGLLGYIWMKGKFDPNSRLYLHKSTVTFMLVWFFLCFTPFMGNVANGAHAAGLVVGVAWGYLTTPHFKRFFKK